MKKVLFITAFPPSDKSAAEKNTKRMLEEFDDYCKVDLIYFKDAEDGEYIPDNKSVSVLKIIPNSMGFRRMNALRRLYFHPLFTVRYDNKLAKWIQTQIDKNGYDVIVFDHSQTFLYARNLYFFGKKILLSHDIEAQRVKRSSNNFMYKLCRASERYVLSTPNSQLFALCKKDTDLIESYYGLSAKVVNIYIDKRIESYTPEKYTDDFILFGNWIRRDNYEGALWLLNGIGKYLSTPISIKIIGKNFPVDRIGNDVNLKIKNLGFVDDPYPIIAQSKAVLCPLFSGAGIKVKVIEALASGTPVLGTEIAFEGFSDKFSQFMIRCDNLKDFAEMTGKIEFGTHQRLSFKKLFLDEYKSETIPEWIKSLPNDD